MSETPKLPEQDEEATSIFERLRNSSVSDSPLRRFSAPFLTILLVLLCGLIEYAVILSNPVPREIAFMQHYFQTQVQQALPAQTAASAPVDQFLARCPTREALDALEADLAISFEFDLTNEPLACTAAAGSRDLSLFEKRFYNTILLMKEITFSQPLPWTNKPLYEWFVGAIDGIRVRSDVEVSYCCDPGGVINIRTHNLVINKTERWLEPGLDDGVARLFLLLVHESRHSEGYIHDCAGNSDLRLTQMGAWGVQYMLDAWLVKYAEPAFFTAPDVDYREFLLKDAENIVQAYICQKPTPEATP